MMVNIITSQILYSRQHSREKLSRFGGNNVSQRKLLQKFFPSKISCYMQPQTGALVNSDLISDCKCKPSILVAYSTCMQFVFAHIIICMAITRDYSINLNKTFVILTIAFPVQRLEYCKKNNALCHDQLWQQLYLFYFMHVLCTCP